MAGYVKNILIFVVVVYLLVYFGTQKKERKKPSELIEIARDYTNFFLETKQKLELFMRETTFDDLVDNHVRPAVAKLQSIRKQTEIYERMDRIQGGPQNFMSTSLAILEDIYLQLLDWEKKYRLATFRLQKSWPGLLKLVDEVQAKVSYLHSDEFFEPLNKFQVHFQPMDYDDDERKLQNKRAITNPMPINSILSIMDSQLLPLIKRFEEIKISKNQVPELDMDKEVIARDVNVITVLGELIPHVKSFTGHYNQLGVFWTNILRDLKYMCNTAVEKAEKSKSKYEDLASGMDLEITNLKERIKNLKSQTKKVEL